MYVAKCFPFLSHLLGAAKEKVKGNQYISLYFLGFFTELHCIGSMDFKIMTIIKLSIWLLRTDLCLPDRQLEAWATWQK